MTITWRSGGTRTLYFMLGFIMLCEIASIYNGTSGVLGNLLYAGIAPFCAMSICIWAMVMELLDRKPDSKLEYNQAPVTGVASIGLLSLAQVLCYAGMMAIYLPSEDKGVLMFVLLLVAFFLAAAAGGTVSRLSNVADQTSHWWSGFLRVALSVAIGLAPLAMQYCSGKTAGYYLLILGVMALLFSIRFKRADTQVSASI